MGLRFGKLLVTRDFSDSVFGTPFLGLRFGQKTEGNLSFAVAALLVTLTAVITTTTTTTTTTDQKTRLLLEQLSL